MFLLALHAPEQVWLAMLSRWAAFVDWWNTRDRFDLVRALLFFCPSLILLIRGHQFLYALLLMLFSLLLFLSARTRPPHHRG